MTTENSGSGTAKPRREKIGALWIKELRDGRRIMTGMLEMGEVKTKIVIFRTTEKKTERSPDFTIYIDNYVPPQGDGGGAAGHDQAPYIPF